MSRRSSWAASAVVCLLTIAAGAARFHRADGVSTGDLPVYRHAARLMSLGELPYRDFAVEYPPGGAGLFGLADLLPGRYELSFAALMVACACAAVIAIVATGRALGMSAWHTAAGAALVPAAVWGMGDLAITRYDLAVTALLAWLVWCAVTRRWTWVWVLMAAAVLMKLVPIALAPALLVAHLHAAPPRRVVRAMAPGALLGAAVVLPFAVIAPRGLWASIAYHLDRPLQIESTGSAVLLVAHHVTGLGVRVTRGYGSDNLVGALPDAVAAGGSLLGILLVAVLAVSLHRGLRAGGGHDPALLAATLAATLLVLVATGKVLSDQYLLWLPPVIALLPARRAPLAVPMFIAAVLISHRIFPGEYRALVEDVSGRAVILLAARDVLLVLIAVTSWPTAASPRKGNAHASRDDLVR